jgi:uncharacterized cysteine cluster protein YcgN (CxxCxxCC family)
MPLQGSELQRFDLLKAGKWIDPAYLGAYYGLTDLRKNKDLGDALTRFASANPVEGNGNVDRYALELFMQKHEAPSLMWFAATLGGTVELLRLILAHQAALDLPPRTYVLFHELIDKRLHDDLLTSIKALRFRTFADHESFCLRLHTAIADTLKLNYEKDVRPYSLWCETDEWLEQTKHDGDYPRRYAMHFDCITCKPISVAHSAWLDFKKPMTLGPDRCSKRTYAQNRQELLPYKAGRSEPDDLDRYQ